MAISSTLCKVALGVMLIGICIFIVGFATPYWRHEEIHTRPTEDREINEYIEGSENNGLWRVCHYSDHWTRQKQPDRRVSYCRGLIHGPIPDELRATQFFETVGLILLIPALLCLVMFDCVHSCKEKRALPIVSAVLTLAAAGCIIVGAIIFGCSDHYKFHLAWSFPLVIVGGVVFIVTGALILIGVLAKL